VRHLRSDANSAEQVLLNKHQISGGRAYLDCYPGVLVIPVTYTWKTARKTLFYIPRVTFLEITVAWKNKLRYQYDET